MAGIVLVVLPRQHEDLDVGRQREQFADELEALIRAVRCRRQPEVDQRQFGRRVQLAQHAFDLHARIGHINIEVAAEHEIQRIGDERIIVDDQQVGFGWRLCPLAVRSEPMAVWSRSIIVPGQIQCAPTASMQPRNASSSVSAPDSRHVTAPGVPAKRRSAVVDDRHAVADLLDVGQRVRREEYGASLVAQRPQAPLSATLAPSGPGRWSARRGRTAPFG